MNKMPYDKLRKRAFQNCLAGTLACFAAAAASAMPSEGVPSRVKNLEAEHVEWRSVGPGGGGWIQSICLSRWDRNLAYVGCDVGGFYVSVDSGRHWEIRNSGLNDFYVETIAEHPVDHDTIFIGTRSGVYVTHDQGRRWMRCSAGFPNTMSGSYSAPISKIVFAPNDPRTIYAAIGQPRESKGGQGQIYVSRDGGNTWTKLVPTGALPPKAVIRDLVISPADAQRLLVATDEGLYLSRDGGISWNPSNSGLPAHLRTRQLAMCPALPSVIYATIRQKGGEQPWSAGVYRSDDGGETWRARNNGLRQNAGKAGSGDMLCSWTDKIVVHPANPDIVYAGGASWWETGIYKTTDGGASWKHILKKCPEGWIGFWGQSVKCLSLSPAAPDALAFGTSGMVYRTDDGGETWHQRYCEQLPDGRTRGTGLEVTCLHTICPDAARKGRFFLGYYDIGLLVTEDDGRTLRRTMKGIPGKYSNSCFSIVQAPDDPLHLWGGFGNWGGGGTGIVAESSDGGENWIPCTAEGSGWVEAPARAITCFGKKGAYRLVYTSKNGLVSSDDGGQRWNVDADFAFTALTRDGDSLYAAKQERKESSSIWKSQDEGRSWTRLTSPSLGIGEIRKIAAKGNDILFSARQNRLGAKSGGAWYSRDGGATFRRVVDDYFCEGVLLTADALLVSLHDHPYHDLPGGGGIRISRDGGATWRTLNSPSLQNRNVSCIAADPFNPSCIWAGTGGDSVFVGEISAR